jgi:hypothetical protein
MYILGSDVLVHTCNPSTCEAEAEDHKFEDSLGQIKRPCLNKQTNILRNTKTLIF